jgi:hypothetical protein
MHRFSLRSLLIFVAVAAVVFRIASSRIETFSNGMTIHAATDRDAYLEAKADLCSFLITQGYSQSEPPRWHVSTQPDLDTWFVMRPNATPIYVRVSTDDSTLEAQVCWRRGVAHIFSDGKLIDISSVSDPVASWFFAWQANKGLPGVPPSSLPTLHQTAFPGSPLLPKYSPK